MNMGARIRIFLRRGRSGGSLALWLGRTARKTFGLADGKTAIHHLAGQSFRIRRVDQGAGMPSG